MKVHNIRPSIPVTFLYADRLEADALSLTSDVAANVLSISLEPGVWDLCYDLYFVMTGSSSTEQISGISATSNTLMLTPGMYIRNPKVTTNLSSVISHSKAIVRLNVHTLMTYHLVARITYTAGTATVFGEIRAKR